MFKVSSFPLIEQKTAKDLKAVKELIEGFSQAHGTPDLSADSIDFMLTNNNRLKMQNMPYWLLFERVEEEKKKSTRSTKKSIGKRKSKD